MNFAKIGCQKALGQLEIKNNMTDDDVINEVSAFWNSVLSFVNNDLNASDIEKNIYKILLARQISSPLLLHKWKQISTPDVAPVKESKTAKLQKILLVAAMAATFTEVLLTVIERKSELCLVGLVIFALIALVFYFFKPRKNEHVPPPPKQPVCHWDKRAIESYLTNTAKAIDIEAEALIPRSNNEPEALEMIKNLLGQIYQGVLPKDRGLLGMAKSYLRLHNIQIVEYSPETAHMFSEFPADGNMTLLPALVQDGKLISGGEACKKSD